MTIRKGNTIIAGNTPAGYEIGDIGLSAIGIDESLNYRRYLNGQEILQSQFKEFTKKIKRRVELYPSLACTNEEYETACALSAHGQCGKFVIDDGRGVIRLPKVVNVMGLSDMAEAGVTVDAGLPNITGKFGTGDYTGAWYGALDLQADGCFRNDIPCPTSSYYLTGQGNGSDTKAFAFDASHSNPTYGNSETVQQEAIKYPYFIQVASSCETTINLTRDIELNNPFSLFEYKFSEYAINNISWLESKGQWNEGSLYVSAYEELLAIYNGKVREGVSVKNATETYTDYDFVIDEAGNAFRLPIATGNRFIVFSHKISDAAGYNIYNDGFYEEWGHAQGNGAKIVLNNVMADRDYHVNLGGGESNGWAVASHSFTHYDKTVSGFYIRMEENATLASGMNSHWYVNGFLASGQYEQYVPKLYFYVGETVQDSNLINAGAVLEDVNTLKNTALTTSQITNCITEIPQRIKLELAEGVLTLKAGSEVIIPNGFEEDGVTPKFDYMTVESDLMLNYGSGNSYQFVVFYGRRRDNNKQDIWYRLDQECFSGTTAPTTRQYMAWYDTNTNLLKYTENTGQNWYNVEDSFPICIITASQKVDSIDQVFNGFGYIGGRVWADKGVKVLIPNGRNTDGTLKNIEVVTDKVQTVACQYTDGLDLGIKADGTFIANTFNSNQGTYFVYMLAEKPAVSGSYSWCFSNQDNRWYRNQGTTTWQEFPISYIGRGFCNSNLKITSTQFKQPFRAIDKYEVSGMGMPSNRYFGLTLGASGTTYTAPANGYILLRRFSNAIAQHLTGFNSSGIGDTKVSSIASQALWVWFPVKKGEAFTITYTAGGDVEMFRFIYAQGEV